MNRTLALLVTLSLPLIAYAQQPTSPAATTEQATPVASPPPKSPTASTGQAPAASDDDAVSEPTLVSDPSHPNSASLKLPPRKENWSVLALDKSGLDLSRSGAVVMQTWETTKFTRELLRVEFRPGDPMDIYVVRPHGAVKPQTILYLYGYTNDTDSFKDDTWCERMTKDGFAAVGFVSAVTGHRFHAPRPLNQWFVGQLQESMVVTAHDVQMILNYLETRGDLDVTKVGMFGKDSGASIAILAASVDHRLAVLDLLNPWGDWPVWLKESAVISNEERDKYLTPNFLANVTNLDPVSYLPKLADRQVRMQFVKTDPEASNGARDAMVAASPKTATVVVYNDEGAHYKDWQALGLSGWIEAQLHPPSPMKNQPTSTTIASTRH